MLPFIGSARFLFKGVIMATAFDELINAIIEMEVPSPIPKPEESTKKLDLIRTLIGILQSARPLPS